MPPRLSLHICDERALIEAHKGFHNDDIHFDLGNLTVRTALVIAGRGRSSDRKTRRRAFRRTISQSDCLQMATQRYPR